MHTLVGVVMLTGNRWTAVGWGDGGQVEEAGCHSEIEG